MGKLVLFSKDNQLNKYKSFNLMHKIYYTHIINIYLGRSSYFPHFNKIFVLYDDYELETIQMIYNMLNINGKLYLLQNEKYQKYFPDYKKKKDFYIIEKLNNIHYIIPTYRTVEFIICGVQASIDELITLNLSRHPDVYLNTNSDPKYSQAHFFDINWQYGTEYYKSFFNYSKKIVGEKTASLIYLKYTYPLIYSINPHVKLIIILLNPAYRAYYHYIMARDTWRYPKTFEEAIEEELNEKLSENVNFYTAARHFVQKGYYYDQLSELLKWFPRYNILILFEEDIFKNKELEFNKLANFLNIDNNFVDIKINKRNDIKMDDNIYNKLINMYKDDIVKLEKLLNIKTNWI